MSLTSINISSSKDTKWRIANSTKLRMSKTTKQVRYDRIIKSYRVIVDDDDDDDDDVYYQFPDIYEYTT